MSDRLIGHVRSALCCAVIVLSPIHSCPICLYLFLCHWSVCLFDKHLSLSMDATIDARCPSSPQQWNNMSVSAQTDWLINHCRLINWNDREKEKARWLQSNAINYAHFLYLPFSVSFATWELSALAAAPAVSWSLFWASWINCKLQSVC